MSAANRVIAATVPTARPGGQNADAECGLGLHVKMSRLGPVRVRSGVVGRPRMHVHVAVPAAVVLVLVHVHALSERLPDSPGSDRDENQSHQPLAPLRQPLDRQDLPEKQGRQAHDHDARGVPETPQ